MAPAPVGVDFLNVAAGVLEGSFLSVAPDDCCVFGVLAAGAATLAEEPTYSIVAAMRINIRNHPDRIETGMLPTSRNFYRIPVIGRSRGVRKRAIDGMAGLVRAVGRQET